MSAIRNGDLQLLRRYAWAVAKMIPREMVPRLDAVVANSSVMWRELRISRQPGTKLKNRDRIIEKFVRLARSAERRVTIRRAIYPHADLVPGTGVTRFNQK